MAVDPSELPDAQDDPAPDPELEEGAPESDAAETPAPSEEEPSSPSADEVDVVQELRSRLAANGRELRATQEANTHLAGRLASTEQRLESIGAALTAREKREMDTYLSSLPQDQREREELRIKVERLEARQASNGNGAETRLTPDQEIQATKQRAYEMAQAASVEFGLDEGEHIQWNDSRLNWASPEAYYASVRRLARQIAVGKADAAPPQSEQPTPWGGASSVTNSNVQKGDPKRAASAANVDVKKIVEDTTKAVLKELQGNVGGAPHSARPAASTANPFSDLVSDRRADPYQQALDKYKNTSGPRATRAKLKERLAEAEQAFGRLAR